MNIAETGRVLAKASAIDNRDVGQAAVLAWHEVLHDLDYTDALDAVARHRRESHEYLQPVHIRRLVRIIRDERRASTVAKALPPGRFENDPERAARTTTGAARVRQMLAEIASKRSVPGPDTNQRPPTRSESVHARALASICTVGAPLRGGHVHHTQGKQLGDDMRFLVASCRACNLHIGDPAKRADPPNEAVTKW
jgi:hypothetical protein